MAVRNDLKGGTDFLEEGLRPTDLNDTMTSFYQKYYADNNRTEVSNTTTETDIATITINQNDLGDNFSAAIQFFGKTQLNTTGSTVTLRLYVDGSVVNTETVEWNGTDLGQGMFGGLGWLATGLDSTAANIIIKVSAQPSSANVSTACKCTGFIVTAIEDNS